MSDVGQNERATQNRVVKLFDKKTKGFNLGYTYLGNFQDNDDNKNIDETLLSSWLRGRGISDTLITKTLREIDQATAIGGGRKLYDANKAFYLLLRYGVTVKEDVGSKTQTVWLIDWKDTDTNDFYIAEEVSVKGENKKRPDIVLYINGIAIAVLELKRSSVSVSEGIRQNLDNQKKEFIRDFFSSMQLVLAGNDTEGLRYGTTATPEKYYLEWKEENPEYNSKMDAKEHKFLPNTLCDGGTSRLDCDIIRLLNKKRLIELLHDFILFDSGTKKACRQNQYFGVKAAQRHIAKREGGIIWHTQGSGKSLTMVWLAKWIRENIINARVLVITDRTELDEQIEKVFKGVEEQIYRTKNGKDLIGVLDKDIEWLMCTLVHKFGSHDKKTDDGMDEFIRELQNSLPKDFKAKGELFVFVDECHRTQSGELHKAMKMLLPNAMFIGFTGTPLLKADKQKSIEVFGSYIHTYKFDEAVADGVVLDLQYEARNIEQNIGNQKKIDEWFDLKTKGLSDIAKTQLKQRWGTLQKVLSSKSRLEQIAQDILIDMETKPRLMDGRGNAMLVCSSVYEACKTYEIFSKTDLKEKVAIVTSYMPSIVDIKGQESGEGQNEDLLKYEVYKKMLSTYFEEREDEAIKKVEEFEKQVKKKFIDEPGQMRLLIVVDKLLTGFDAPSATYLYIDKKLRDHALFQAICRVNRLDGDDKEYGYIVDYQDLFNKIEGAIEDYTSGALDGFDKEDVAHLLTDRLKTAKERLEDSLESLKALCEPVEEPKKQIDYIHYFCGKDTTDKEALKENEPKRLALYKSVVALIRSYANIAGEYEEAGYSFERIQEIKKEVEYYEKIREEIKLASGDYIDMKLFDPAMRQLIDMYIRADDSEVVSDFDNISLVELILGKDADEVANHMPKGMRNNDAMSEAMENNIRKLIIDENPLNPKYYEKMSELLDEIIRMRKEEMLNYKEYLVKIKELASKVKDPMQSNTPETPTPISINTKGKKALFDNLGSDEGLVLAVHDAVLSNKKDDWIGNMMKERRVRNAVETALGEQKEKTDVIMGIIKAQHEYK